MSVVPFLWDVKRNENGGGKVPVSI
jgi:hypothetical protein